MAPVDRDKLRHHLQYVRERVRRLHDIRSRGREAFLADATLQAATIRYLQTGIEAMVDAANHLIAREGLGVPRTYRDSIGILVEHSILPANKKDAFEAMVRFRNRAVHLYDEIDPAEVFAILERDLGDFDAFIEAVATRYMAGD